jgi:hypothetical protein
MQRLNKTNDARLNAKLRELAQKYPARPLPSCYVLPARACLLLASWCERLGWPSLADRFDAIGFWFLVQGSRRW